MRLLLILLITVIILVAGCSAPESSAEMDAFAKCLTDNGAKMFGAFWCSHCKAQKAEFGTSFQYVDYIECSMPDGKSQTEYCSQQGIKGYPTWQFADTSRRSGEVSLKELALKTGCQSPE